MRYLSLILFVCCSVSLFGQIGSDEFISGPGYLYPFPGCINAPEASCNNVHVYEIVDNNCQPANNNNCPVNFKWQIRDAGTDTYLLSHNGMNNWSLHYGTVIELVESNLKLTILDINCNNIALRIEILDYGVCGEAQIFGLSAGTGVGNIGVVDTDCYVDEDDCGGPPPTPCIPDIKLTECDDMNCIAIYNSTKYPCSGCFCTDVNFTDGSSSPITVDFNQFETVMMCFDKEINPETPTSTWVEIECKSCGKPKFSLPRSEDVLPESSITLAPNPTNNYFEIIDESGSSATVTIFDLTGAVYGSHDIGDNHKVDVRKLPAGIYIVKVQNQAGNTLQALKFVKN